MGDCENGNDNDDLFMTTISSCSGCSSVIVAGCPWFGTKNITFSSYSFEVGEMGGESGKMEIGGSGDEVAEVVDS